jgi:hypothetical protein
MHPEHVGNEFLRSWSIDSTTGLLIQMADVRYRTDRLNPAG